MNNLYVLIQNLADITQPDNKKEFNQAVDLIVELWAENSFLFCNRCGPLITIKQEKSICYLKN